MVLEKLIRPKDLCDAPSNKYSHVHPFIWIFFSVQTAEPVQNGPVNLCFSFFFRAVEIFGLIIVIQVLLLTFR